ncbi:MAG: single-stranded DNA-binding protein, partial [Rhabdochlamydiaceae bacterium]
MTYSLASLRKNSSLDKLKAALESKNKPRNDERFWQPSLDKAENGFAVIRFLPAAPVDGENGQAAVQYFTHAFQGPGGWLIENCPTTISHDCPICKDNGKLWNSGITANKDLARARKRKLKFVSNILVIQDPHHPENNGQVKLYGYGIKILDKIMEKVSPPDNEYEKVAAVDVFDWELGANFTLRISRQGKFLNYDKSTFGEVTPAAKSETEFEALWNKEYSLKPFIAESEFKDSATLSGRLNRVLSVGDDGMYQHNPQKDLVASHKPMVETVTGTLTGPPDEAE